MKFSTLWFTALTVLALSVGQVLFKLAARSIEFSAHGWPSLLFNFRLHLALAVYLVATFSWLYVLQQVPLRVAYPYAGLAFVFVPLLSVWWLGESVPWTTYLGAALILCGIWVSALK